MLSPRGIRPKIRREQVVGALSVLKKFGQGTSWSPVVTYGFIRQKSTGTVSLDDVYSTGKHFIGPDFEFKVFQADAHFLELDRIRAFTSDRLEVQVSATMQYFLRKEDLPLLHRRFDLQYEDVVMKSAEDALKGEITKFTTRELYEKRAETESSIYKAVRQRLGGVCCAINCNSFQYACPPGCIERDFCLEENKGVFVDVKYFQLGEVFIHRDVEERYLKTLTLKEDNEREKLIQDAQVERKRTDKLVRQRKNEVLEIQQQAEALSKLLRVESVANYTVIVEGARSKGLKDLYAGLGITQQIYKNSFDYLRTLRGLENVWLTVDFDQRIVGSLDPKGRR
ncbi:hypothetical protein FSP39_010818 [Pinctada imbricata]|uniref:Band 7 domain-containing protein n=1 Tax=Pinctada imbricata TaxID=66713 RepID=A0AA89BUP7_PINIB|nr:hypothetical protein FSP39_010818 [Pinctada imbricata]